MAMVMAMYVACKLNYSYNDRLESPNVLRRYLGILLLFFVRFYLPHGLTLDYQNNLWLTDVAMHQVFKISSDSDEPEMTFGQAFSPGSDADHLCKPTDVAVCSKTGDIFIADG